MKTYQEVIAEQAERDKALAVRTNQALHKHALESMSGSPLAQAAQAGAAKPNPLMQTIFDRIPKDAAVGSQVSVVPSAGYVIVEGSAPDDPWRHFVATPVKRAVAGHVVTEGPAANGVFIGFDPASGDDVSMRRITEYRPGEFAFADDEQWPTFYDAGKDEMRPVTQADVDLMHRRCTEQHKALCERDGPIAAERDRLCRMIEAMSGGQPLWFENPIKGDVLSGHKWDGGRWVKLQMVEASPGVDRIWESIEAASRR